MKILATSPNNQPNPPRAPKASRRPQHAQGKLLKDSHLGGLGVLGAHFDQTAKISGQQPNPPKTRVCAQCGSSEPPLDPHRDMERRHIVYLHRECVRIWQRTHR